MKHFNRRYNLLQSMNDKYKIGNTLIQNNTNNDVTQRIANILLYWDCIELPLAHVIFLACLVLSHYQTNSALLTVRLLGTINLGN